MTQASNLGKGGSNFNSTGQLSLTTGVTGILPVANGGTGTSTGVAPGGSTTQIQYNNAGAFAGSANMTFNGTTLTTTGLSDSGNLTFTGTGNRITGDFSNGTATNRVAFQSSTTNGATEVGFIPNGTSTQSSLRVFNATDPANANSIVALCNATEARLLANSAGTATAIPLVIYTGGSERLRIDTSGNVGIGTNSPTQLLDVSGNAAVTGTGFLSLQRPVIPSVANTGSPQIVFRFYSTGTTYTSGALISALSDDAWSSTSAPTALRFLTVPSGSTTLAERMRIDSSGNVRIGTTGAITTNERLTVATATTDTYSAFQQSSGITAVFGVDATGAYSGSYTNQAYVFRTNNTERMRIDTSGNVAIGESSAQGHRLNVNVGGSSTTRLSNDALRLASNGSGADVNMNFTDGVANNSYIGMVGGNLYFDTGGTERMRITSAGGVSFGATGTAYGTSGQVLTSAGNAPPTWGAVSGTAKAYGFINSSSGSSVLSNSFNVSSVTLTSTGQNTINWSTAFANAQYVIVATTNKGDSNNDMNAIVQTGVTGGSRQQSTTQAFLSNGYTNNFQNSQQVCFVVFSN